MNFREHLTQKTCASIMDNEEGLALSLQPTRIIDGKKYVQVEKLDIVLEIEYWQSSLYPVKSGFLNWIFRTVII